MYGKHFSSMYEGSMMGAGPTVFAVWGYVISKADGGFVELNPRLLSVLLGTSELEIIKAIEYLCAPDPNSRSTEKEGRRLVKIGQFAYEVTTHAHYRSIRNTEDRRAYMREYMSKRRKQSLTDVNNGKQVLAKLAHTEAEAEAETKKRKSVEYDERFESFWSSYPNQRRTKKKEAYRIWKTVIKSTDPNLILEKVREYAASERGRGEYSVMPSVWLNSGMWEDDPAAWNSRKRDTVPTQEDMNNYVPGS
jgi:hypothetical protein